MFSTYTRHWAWHVPNAVGTRIFGHLYGRPSKGPTALTRDCLGGAGVVPAAVVLSASPLRFAGSPDELALP
eukprot:1825701-Karenia_brevis.AAC.1